MVKNKLFELNFNIGDLFYYDSFVRQAIIVNMGKATRYPIDTDRNTLMRTSYILGVGLICHMHNSSDFLLWWIEYFRCRRQQ